ncbi:hypothetical protein PHYPSEUDO_011423 [Phytophthora pseudosyringae]|uniref:Transmembrane protein n=1 Tax=Phytophthora pseudosyringae TaxID=221518 RepID=A0A8T1V957_9STRA|nr:hypothetical protein PHYPSEUDO_011423 [Phytophthora pseudosyringae]
MNVAFRCVAVLFLLSMEVDALIFQQRPSSAGRHLQREENESDSTASDFLAEEAAAMLKDGADTEDFSNFAAFIDALVARASSSIDSPFYSNWSSAVDREIDAASSEGAAFEDVGSDFTPSPGFNSDTDASSALDQAAGSTFSASGELEGAVGGDANMANGENLPSSLAVLQLPSFILVLIIAVNALALAH